jgi:hypothetical protein
MPGSGPISLRTRRTSTDARHCCCSLLENCMKLDREIASVNIKLGKCPALPLAAIPGLKHQPAGTMAVRHQVAQHGTHVRECKNRLAVRRQRRVHHHTHRPRRPHAIAARR